MILGTLILLCAFQFYFSAKKKNGGLYEWTDYHVKLLLEKSIFL